jgi:5'-3' exonuclease
VTVVGEDTDVLVLLLFHSPLTSHIIYRSDKSAKYPQRCWDIQKTQDVLGQSVLSVLPVMYALTGCDTTSRIFGIGKSAAIKKASNNTNIHDNCLAFLEENADPQHIIESGEKILVALYGGSSLEKINTLRYRKWACKVISNTFTNVQVNTLPPTSDAAKYHSLRTYHKVRECVHNVHTDPINWGWMLKKTNFIR